MPPPRSAGGRGRRELLVVQTGLPQLLIQRLRDGRARAQGLGGLLAARSDALASDLEPDTALLDQPPLDPEVEQLVRPRDADAVQDVELRLPERWGQLVLHHLDPRAVADHLLAGLDRADAADGEADRGVEP